MVSVNVVNFDLISIFEGEFAPSTFPLLPLQKVSYLRSRHGVLFQPLTPVQQIAIIRACVSFHFRIGSDDVCLTMRSELDFFGHGKCLANSSLPPVFLVNPFLTLVGMTPLCPTEQLEVQAVVASRKYLGCFHCSVVIGPSSRERIEFLDERLL